MRLSEKKRLLFVLQVVVTLAAFGFAFQKVSLGDIWDGILQADPFLLLAAFLLYNASQILSSYRSRVAAKSAGVKLPMRMVTPLYYMGMFYNMFLPGGLGGDTFRVLHLKRYGKLSFFQWARILLMERASGGVAILVILALLAPLQSFVVIRILHGWWVPLLSLPLFLWLWKLTIRWTYRDLEGAAAKLFFLSFFLQSLQAFMVLLLAHSISATEISVPDLALLFFLSSFFSLLPISVGGAGVREMVFIYGMGMLGLEAVPGGSIAFSIFLIIALSSLTGGIFTFVPFSSYEEKDRSDRGVPSGPTG